MSLPQQSHKDTIRSVEVASIRTSLEEHVYNETNKLSLLSLMSEMCEGPLGDETILDNVLNQLASSPTFSTICLFVIDRGHQEVVLDRAPDLTANNRKRSRFTIKGSFWENVLTSGQPAVIEQLNHPLPTGLDRLNPPIPKRAASSENGGFIAVPIRYGEELVGILTSFWTPHNVHSLQEDISVLRIAAQMIAPNAAARQAQVCKGVPNNMPDVQILGRSKATRSVIDAIRTVSPSDSTVLILGESGTGKELVADAIHRSSRRREGPFVKVNCAALPEGVLESELFGHEVGAFTGAIQQRIGRFESASHGTIFLDEIGDLPVSTQVALLRTLQERTLQRVGGNIDIKVNVRVIAATHRDLTSAIASGEFRQDLYYRLDVFPIRVPSLRERRTDIPLLADHFVERYAETNRKQVHRISSRAIDMLMAYHWPGNVRELENCIERAVLLCEDHVIHGRHLPPTLQMDGAKPSNKQGSLEVTLDAIERDMLDEALKTAKGNMAEAARKLGITERKMGLRVRRYHLDPRRHRQTR
ncbi:MAG: sigma 54-interacting transcriptional regulator [Myxococcales bacterium]|nr:sigma 54-interacting transcriptional regulator [Myxococcales bacterium]